MFHYFLNYLKSPMYPMNHWFPKNRLNLMNPMYHYFLKFQMYRQYLMNH
jgi:hypothetical protein